MKLKLVCISISIFLFGKPISSLALTTSYTVIVNQVRGDECCQPGNTEYFMKQLTTLQNAHLPATFALRYDALTNPTYTEPLRTSGLEPAGFLEITPSLAKASGVRYLGNDQDWFKAQYAYSVGYSQSDRKKLLDTYMSTFYDTFGKFPQTTVGWITDSWSLRYLKETYNVSIHEITREQFGTDSYTLYGGPPHYPYSPSSAWALIPSPDLNSEMPLIMRQTITDPEHNYGDTTNSYTSQPNDYMIRRADISYFTHLFNQAHQQHTHAYTWALIGLENSMPGDVQDEFLRQLAVVAQWRNNSQTNKVITAGQFANMSAVNAYPHVYASNNTWWITTPSYRVRVRLDAGELFIDDIRIYSLDFKDPYTDAHSDLNAQWIVPFVLDGSRFFQDERSIITDTLARDMLKDREHEYPSPTRITISSTVQNSGVTVLKDKIVFKQKDASAPLATFRNDSFELPHKVSYNTQNATLDRVLKNFIWRSDSNDELWGLRIKKDPNKLTYIPFAKNESHLDAEREKHYPLLFPTVKDHELDPHTTHLYLNNVTAITQRNPVRVVLYPRDSYSYPVQVTTTPNLTTSDTIDSTRVDSQQIQNGMLFLDFIHSKPLQTTATVQLGSFSQKFTIYFAPNCKRDPLYCLRHPIQATWYIRNFIHDSRRRIEDDSSML